MAHKMISQQGLLSKMNNNPSRVWNTSNISWIPIKFNNKSVPSIQSIWMTFSKNYFPQNGFSFKNCQILGVPRQYHLSISYDFNMFLEIKINNIFEKKPFSNTIFQIPTEIF